ncbi:MAG: DUF4157 domain-containing protein [Anaerolineales bacterium]|nr:DUF4157 domain-containing protein [Anaerolineales bacterium]
MEEEQEYVRPKPMEGQSQQRVLSQASIHANRCPGKSLSTTTRDYFEPRFGTDFSDVRVHTCGDAIQMCAGLNAQAFTHGNSIYFNHGKYRPATFPGKRLLAHELTHIVQQRENATGRDEIRRLVNVHPASAAGEIAGYFNFLCDGGTFIASGRSIVGNCPPEPAKDPNTPLGCECICDTVNDPNRTYNIHVHTVSNNPRYYGLYGCDNLVVKVPYPSVGPHTIPGTHPFIHMAAGTGNAIEFGAFKPSGEPIYAPKWRILAHELCGHGRLNQGYVGDKGNRPGHDKTIKTENEIAAEHGHPERGLFKSTRQGESFHYKVEDSSKSNVCSPRDDSGRAVFKLKDGWYYEKPSPYPLPPHLNCTLDHFQINSAVLTTTHLKNLPEISMKVLSLQKGHKRGEALVTGHADAPGSVEYNESLGWRRAERVRSGLQNYCIPSSTIFTNSKGERELLIPTERYEPRNRRVVTKFRL